TAMDNSFVSFVQPIDSSTIEVPKLITPTSLSNGSNIQLSLMVNVNQDAEVCLIIDPSAGDMLKAVGEGDLKVDFNVNTSDLKIYGNYVLDRGEYTFTFQNALRKQFSIQQGSSLYWSGVPYDAEVNINAGYQLSASLVDLFGESILSTSNRNSVPVLCLVNLTGNLMHPNIKFDITLPNSDDELNRSLKSTINTEEMMNRQIVYLLAFNKFYTPEYLKTNSQNELLALASSTLSSQLNSWASQLLDKWDFGVNFRTSGEGETRSNEYEFAFLYSPNNKLFINGNLGYRDDNFSASKFIGDVDVEYKLTRRGKLRAKAYNHTNDYKEFKTALTTQGVGLVYRENFSSLKDLVAEWKEDIRKSKEERAIRKEKRAAQKKEKEEKKNQEQKEEVK
ncbi:MAG: translocation/assembly module TamB domain-containing protein, partial [Paludibacteraceae bacterium]|nr:translocation/assembly module TamB domain-containing protein [Paludibacteraceae bacterium]